MSLKEKPPQRIVFEDESSDDESEENTENKQPPTVTSFSRNSGINSLEETQETQNQYDEKDSDTESSSDEDNLEPDNPEFNKDFLRVLATLMLKHPSANEEKKFFKDAYPSTSEESQPIPEEEKAVTIEALQKEEIRKRMEKFENEKVTTVEESDSDDEDEEKAEVTLTGDQEGKFTFVHSSDEDDGEELFTKKEPTPEEEAEKAREKENQNDVIAFLQGKKVKLSDKVDEELFRGLKEKWHKDMSEEDKYLMDYFVNQRYLEEEDDRERAPNHYALDMEPLSDDERTLEKMEEYDTKYRFRFEEPDEDFIRRYPRVIEDTVRNKDSKRKEARERKKSRLHRDKERKQQELKRQRASQRKEILEKIERLKTAAGINTEREFEGIDLDDDFDPDKHDAAMNRMFDDQYYDEGGHEDLSAVRDEELYRELQEQYDKLDLLDDMTEGTYKYQEVTPNDYGLTVDEILNAKDSELNKWYHINKVIQYNKSEFAEQREIKTFRHRASLPHVKTKIFPSLYSDNAEELKEAEERRRIRRNQKKSERRQRKKIEAEKAMRVGKKNEKIRKKKLLITSATLNEVKGEGNNSESAAEGKENDVEEHNFVDEKNNNQAEAQTTALQSDSGKERRSTKIKSETPEDTTEETTQERDTNVHLKRRKGKDTKSAKEAQTATMQSDSGKEKRSTKIKREPPEDPTDETTQERYTNVVDWKQRKGKHRKSGDQVIPVHSNDTETETPTGNVKDIENRPFSKTSSKNKLKDATFVGKKRKREVWFQKNKKQKFSKKEEQRENTLEGISDGRLTAYGENPNKVKKLLKYLQKS